MNYEDYFSQLQFRLQVYVLGRTPVGVAQQTSLLWDFTAFIKHSGRPLWTVEAH